MQYGLPYMGSKSRIAENICAIFPKATHFYDLFGGGFSITHCMLTKRSKDFKHFHFNELRKGMPDLIRDCIAGKYSYENFLPPWISREEFHARKESDLYVKICWSFGNNGITYMFGPDIEPYKRSLHNAVVFNQFDDKAKEVLGIERFRPSYDIMARRLFLRHRSVEYGKRTDLQQLERLEQLQRLQRLQRLEQLQQLERLNFYSGDYRDVKIESDAVVYCDIPYKGTGEYDGNKGFNHKDFFKWVESSKSAVFVSEYNVSEPFMRLVRQVELRQTLSTSSTAGRKLENVYCNDMAWQMMMDSRLTK